MNQPRDIDLVEWLDGVGFHPADTQAKQLAHEAARQQVAWLGQLLHGMLPPGRDKSLTFTALEDVLMRANRALALGGGPNPAMDVESLQRLAAAGPLAEDPRITTYKVDQRGEGVPTKGMHRWSDGTLRPYQETEANKQQDEIEGVRAEQFPRWDGQEPLPEEVTTEYVSSVATDDSDITIELRASNTSGRVQIGVVCSNKERVQKTVTEGRAEGFHAGFTDPDHLSSFLRELSEAGQAAFHPGD